MWGRMAICVAAGSAAVVVWYLFFLRYNRRQGALVVSRIRAALAGSGQVLAVRWLGSSTFHVALRLGTSLFRHPGVRVHLAPRTNPVRWLRQWWCRAPATVTFEADFEVPPGFNLQVGQHRWCGRSRKHLAPDSGQWEFEPVTPLILTSRPCWQREVTGMMNALLSRRDRDTLSLDFRSTSPHFSATIRLDAVPPEGSTGANVFDTLRELAAGASASRQ